MISRIDQAVLLLQDRLQRLGNKGNTGAARTASGQTVQHDPIEQLRELRKRGHLDPDEMRRAFVRTLLADALGDDLGASLEFQSVADQVSGILSGNEAGRLLMDKALKELGLD